MSEDTRNENPSRKRVVYEMPGMDRVIVRPGEVYRVTKDGPLTMDLYRPVDGRLRPLPAVVLVTGYPDAGYERVMGCKFKDTGASTSWARLIAASGLAAITYTNQDPVPDAEALLEHARNRAGSLGIDGARIGLLASSGNVPLALSIVLRNELDRVACATLCYGYLPDDASSALVAEASARWRFANPCKGKTVENLPRHVPLFVARAGRDELPHLNTTIDRFLEAAVMRNLPITFVNHPDAPHAFDLFYDTDATRAVIRQILAFLRAHLLPEAGAGGRIR